MNIGRVITRKLPPLTAIKNICNNVSQIVRGAVEIVPIIGNLTVYIVDKIRIKVIEDQINQEIQTVGKVGREYYANGRLVCKVSLTYSYKDNFDYMYFHGARFRC
jgi:hypothetical protein